MEQKHPHSEDSFSTVLCARLNEVSTGRTRCAINGRVSTRDRGQDVANQLLQLREYTSRSGWVIFGEYRDIASGKSTKHRDAFKALMEDATQRKFDVVLVWSLDPFTRQGVLETLQYVQRLKS